MDNRNLYDDILGHIRNRNYTNENKGLLMVEYGIGEDKYREVEDKVLSDIKEKRVEV